MRERSCCVVRPSRKARRGLPWIGEITVAPILFLSSNPSIGDDRHALGSSTDEALRDSHHHAFGGGTRP
jgi:hypothetical protein